MSALRPTYDPRTKLYTSPFADVDVENGFVNFADAVMSAPHFHDEVPALTNGNTGATFTFKGLSELVDGVARGLQARGFRQGDVFAVGMPNLRRLPRFEGAAAVCAQRRTMVSAALGAWKHHIWHRAAFKCTPPRVHLCGSPNLFPTWNLRLAGW